MGIALILLHVTPCTVPSNLPWKLSHPMVNLSLTKDKKDCTDALFWGNWNISIKITVPSVLMVPRMVVK